MLMWRKGEGGAMSEGRATPPSALVIVPAVMDKHKMLLHNNSNSAPTHPAHVVPMIVLRIFGIFEDRRYENCRCENIFIRDVYLSENDQG